MVNGTSITSVPDVTDIRVTDETITKEMSLTEGVTKSVMTTIGETKTRNETWLSTGTGISSISSSHSTTPLTSQAIFTDQGDIDADGDYDYNSSYNYADYGFNYGDQYMYTGYTFERPFYLYIWEFLVIFTFLANLVVIAVLLRKNMRNPTNAILAAIAISDSLTGLVTLPSYIMVYLKYVSVGEDYEYDYSSNYTTGQELYPDQYVDEGNATQLSQAQEPDDGCELTKSLCNGFMFSKYFLSKSFHTMSIFLTLFLGIQRYISIRYPYRSQFMLSLPRTIAYCVVVVVISPILHVYHLAGERAYDGLCQWELKEEGCGSGCIYLWMAFFIRHLVPCATLVVFTTLFILQLRSGEKNLRRMDSSQSQMSRRKEENRRISLTVSAVVIVFLIPEIPYAIFLLYNAIDKTANQGKGIDLETNRAIHLSYELLLVLSFHANVYIYTYFNRRFRRTLYRTFLKPCRRLFGDTDRLSVSQTSSITHRPSNRKTDTESEKTRFEMESMIRNTSTHQQVTKTNSAASSLNEKDQRAFEGDCNTNNNMN